MAKNKSQKWLEHISTFVTFTIIKKRVALVDDNGNIIKIYPSLLSAAKENKIDPHTLRDRLNGKYSSNNKTKFKYVG